MLGGLHLCGGSPRVTRAAGSSREGGGASFASLGTNTVVCLVRSGRRPAVQAKWRATSSHSRRATLALLRDIQPTSLVEWERPHAARTPERQATRRSARPGAVGACALIYTPIGSLVNTVARAIARTATSSRFWRGTRRPSGECFPSSRLSHSVFICSAQPLPLGGGSMPRLPPPRLP